MGVVKGDMRSLDYSSCRNIISTEGPRSFPIYLLWLSLQGPKKVQVSQSLTSSKGILEGSALGGY